MPNSREEGGTRDAAELYQQLLLTSNVPAGELILLDDVLTGGGHLQASAWALEDAGCKVDEAICCGRSIDTQLDDPFDVESVEIDLNRPTDETQW